MSKGGTEINWGKLTQQNRAKAPGIPWSKEEQAALAAGIPANDVRAGILTREDLEAKPATADLERMTHEQLVQKAQEMGLQFDPDAVGRGDLIQEIGKLEKAAAKQAEPKAKAEKPAKGQSKSVQRRVAAQAKKDAKPKAEKAGKEKAAK